MKSFNWFSPCFKYPYRHDRVNAFIFAAAVLTANGNMEYCRVQRVIKWLDYATCRLS